MKKKAFTLLEFLIVLSIFLFLIAFFSPCLIRPASSQIRGICLSNVRCIGQAMHIYANENNDLFPISNNLPASFGLLFDKKHFNEASVYICPCRKDEKLYKFFNKYNFPLPPSEKNGPLKGSKKNKNIISYLIVYSMNQSKKLINPCVFDSKDNALLIEDFRCGERNKFSPQDNHGENGGNIFTICGQGKWVNDLPKNKYLDDPSKEFQITEETVLSDMGELYDIAKDE